MTSRPLVIVGAGGFGREVLDVVRAINGVADAWDFHGFVADDPPPTGVMERLGTKWLGSIDTYLRGPLADHYVIGIGDPRSRTSIAANLDRSGCRAATLVHPAATVGRDVALGEGTIICSHVSITTNITLGRHVHVNLNSTVGHDSSIGDFVTINPLVAISGAVFLEEGVTMGTHSSVLQGLRVGAGSFVGAGAVVVKDVPDGVTVVGVPARPLA